MRWLALVGALLVTACGGSAGPTAAAHSPIVSATPTPSATAAPHPALGVFVDPTALNYSVLLVGIDGKVVSQVSPTMPAVYHYTHLAPAPPLVSVTNSRVYYADGTSLKYLKPEGSTGVVGTYPGGPQTAAGFAVSPDDRRIAVGQLTYSAVDDPHPKLTMYVEDLGGGNRVDLFSSTTVAEWPVAWTNGHLIIAVGPPVIGNVSSNPYNGFSGYHVVDASNGNRLFTMSDDCLFGPLQAPGTACNSGGNVSAQAFDGTVRVFSPNAGAQNFLIMSPDGSRIAGRPGNFGSALVLFHYQGDVTPVPKTGIPMGWVDDQHLVYYISDTSARAVLDVTSGNAALVPACTCSNSGIFFGALPPS